MEPEVRRQTAWMVIVAIIASLVVFASYRRHEMDVMRKTIATGRPQERLATVQRLVTKEKLAEALQEQPRWVQDQVIAAIAEIGTPEALFQLTGSIYLMDAPTAARAKAILARFDLMAIGPLVKALKDKDGNVRAGAPDPLVAIGEAVIPSLLPLMDAWDQYVRDGVVTVFSKIPEPVTPKLIALIQRTEPLADETPQRFLWKRDTAVRSFLTMKVPALQPIIGQLLTYREPEVRALGAQMLGQIADQSLAPPIAVEAAATVVAPLVERLKSDSAWTVRRKAATALGQLGVVAKDGGAVPVLIAHLKDSRPEVKAASAEALGRVGATSAAGPLVQTLLTNRFGAVREIVVALERLGAASLPALVPALANPDLEVRKAATEAVAVIGTPGAVVPLAGMLKDQDVTIRRLASDALRALADVQVVPQLVAALADPDWHVYYAARDALANVAGPAVPGLIQALGSENSRVAHMAEQALSRIGEQAVAPLTAALASPIPAVRQWAAVALGDIGAEAAAPTVAVLRDLSRPVHAREAAADALGRTGASSAFEPLATAAARQEPIVRKSALRALVRLGNEKATEPLVAALRASAQDVRAVAMQLLIEWRATDLGAILTKALQEGDANARRRAAIALAFHTSAAIHQLIGAAGSDIFGAAKTPSADLEPILAEAVEDPQEQPDVRRYAVRALGYVGRDRALTVMKSLLQPGAPLASDAARAVAAIGVRLNEELYRSGQREYSVRHREPTEAAKLLLDLLLTARDEGLRLDAAVGLSLMGDDPVPGLLNAIPEADDDTRLWLVAVLGAIGKPASDPSLDARGASKDPTVKEWVTVAMPLIADAQAMDLLEHLPEEEQPREDLVAAGMKIKERILDARARA